MNPWWSFDGLKHRLGRFQFMLLLASLLLLAGYIGFRLGGQFTDWQQQEIEKLQSRTASLYEELDQKVRQINYLMVELEVEQHAGAPIQDELLQLRQESLQLRKELNFYQKVLAPELVADGLAIEQFSIENTNRRNHYRFKFALVQTDTKKRNAKGYIRMNLLGVESGQKRSLDLAKLASMDKEALRFSFHYFQYFEGEFSIKEGFLPEDIEIKVIQPKTKWQSYKAFSHKLEWPDLSQ